MGLGAHRAVRVGGSAGGVSGVDVGAAGVAVGVGAMVATAVGERVGEAVGATVAPQAPRPTVAIAALMIAVTFMVVTDQRGRCIRGYVRTKCVERARGTTRPRKRGDGDALKRSGPGRTSPSQRGGVSRMRPSSCRNIRCPHRMIPLRGTEHCWRRACPSETTTPRGCDPKRDRVPARPPCQPFTPACRRGPHRSVRGPCACLLQPPLQARSPYLPASRNACGSPSPRRRHRARRW
jgi:hypothetical protein